MMASNLDEMDEEGTSSKGTVAIPLHTSQSQKRFALCIAICKLCRPLRIELCELSNFALQKGIGINRRQ
jgi:hypothetical protein